MKYQNIYKGKFIDRPNRFIAHVELNGNRETVHVKNTGRCQELLMEGATVYLEKGSSKERKTAYDLVAVEKKGRLVNIDSQAPNKIVGEWLETGELFSGLTLIKPEKTFGESRIDFYLERGEQKILMEVKGVTLENDNIVSFPDAPSERAVKHLGELAKAVKKGYEAYVFFVIQMENVDYFIPAKDKHPQFAKALTEARKKGVHIIAYDCKVTEDGLSIRKPVPVYFSEKERDLQKKNLAPKLLEWYDDNRRFLPWREDPTPYHVWLSEIMLQQTRVEAVKGYYERFLAKIPDIAALAGADEETLLKLWEGLGYYSRVRNLKAAAKQIVEEYEGAMPRNFDELKSLKGIGDYTAGAIASIAFNVAVGAVDGNVLRVLSRFFMDPSLITEEHTKKRYFQEVNGMISKERPGAFNQAMMDLGAMVCAPNGAPHCEICPLNSDCRAHLQGCETEYPKKEDKKARTIEQMTVFVICDQGKIALHKREARGLLAGMYEFPNVSGHKKEDEVLAILKELNLSPLYIKKIQDYVHIFTHKEWHMKGYFIRVDELSEGESCGQAKKWKYVDRSDIEEHFPIPSAFATYKMYIEGKD